MEMETKHADWRLNLPHFVEPFSGSWILRSKHFMDSGGNVRIKASEWRKI
jgi:hypothetical protein